MLLRDTPTSSVSDHELGITLTVLVWRALGYENEFPLPSTLPGGSDHPLWQMPDGAFLQFLLQGIRFFRCVSDSTAPRETEIPWNKEFPWNKGIHEMSLTVCAVLENWPQRWLDILEEIRRFIMDIAGYPSQEKEKVARALVRRFFSERYWHWVPSIS
jgi:hypothetical protein